MRQEGKLRKDASASKSGNARQEETWQPKNASTRGGHVGNPGFGMGLEPSYIKHWGLWLGIPDEL